MQTALIECQETRSVYSGLSLTSFLGIYWSLLWLSFPIRKWSEGKYTHNIVYRSIYIYTVQFSCSVISDYLLPHGLQHARLPCTSPTPRVYPNSCPLSQWCHPTISSSVVTFNVSQHQGLFQWGSSSHEVAKVLEKAMATHSNTLAWKIPWIEGPGGLQSIGSLGVGHDWATSLFFHFHALEKEMATYSSVLAWRIPGTGEPGELPSMGSHRIGHDWRDLVAAAAAKILEFQLQHQFFQWIFRTDFL